MRDVWRRLLFDVHAAGRLNSMMLHGRAVLKLMHGSLSVGGRMLSPPNACQQKIDAFPQSQQSESQ